MWGALAAAGIAGIISLISANKQNKANKGIANRQMEANKQLLREQLEYDKPVNQMARFQEAGLNPHLIYGQGSPGNQGQPLKAPDYKAADYSSLMNMVPVFNQARLTDSQVQAQNATTLQKNAMTELNKIQARVLEKNPLLDDEGFKATIDGLKNTALLKANQSEGQRLENFITDKSGGHQVEKVFKEVQLLEAKFDLSQKDLAIRSEILKSKEFQNELLEVQKRFMADGEVSPGMILNFIQTLLLKFAK